METKEEMNIYHKMLDGKCIMMETTEKTIELNEKFIAFFRATNKYKKGIYRKYKNFC